MPIYVIYRVCIWLPIVVPAALILVANAFGFQLPAGPLVGEVLGYLLIFGGLPYAVLAAWATWWVGGQPEANIRRLMLRAPLLMVAVFVPLALLLGYGLDALTAWTGVALYGAAVILLLGYAYVGLAVILRHSFGPPRSPVALLLLVTVLSAGLIAQAQEPLNGTEDQGPRTDLGLRTKHQGLVLDPL